MAVIMLLSVMVGIWLLLVTSYMDQRSGSFSELPLLLAVMVEIILWVISIVGGYISVSLPYFVVVFVVQFILFIMGKLVYSIGDFGILCVCQYMFLIVCGRFYIQAVFVTVFIALLTYAIRNLFRLKKVLKGKGRMPFTMYIAIGAYVALYLYA